MKDWMHFSSWIIKMKQTCAILRHLSFTRSLRLIREPCPDLDKWDSAGQPIELLLKITQKRNGINQHFIYGAVSPSSSVSKHFGLKLIKNNRWNSKLDNVQWLKAGERAVHCIRLRAPIWDGIKYDKQQFYRNNFEFRQLFLMSFKLKCFETELQGETAP